MTSSIRTLGAGALMVAAAVLAGKTSAYTVYQLEEDYYAIVCQDGNIFSYSGSPSGIGIVGEALCEGHGGIVDGGGGVSVEKATMNIQRTMDRCQKAGREVRKGVMQCPGRVRVPAQRAPAAAEPKTMER